MKVDKILPCICTPEYDDLESLYDGMPLLRVSGGKPNTCADYRSMLNEKSDTQPKEQNR